ncbi:MAG: hypothetical protein NC253_12040 [Ruminococcus sp.]|nr:hypothetical protein [Ruminococcus sp.]MCM1478743.1 hypothetical protein [Muribaculaceae bacterium]
MLLTICTAVFGAVTVWNFVMLIIFFAARKSGGERYEKARSRFLISSAFFVSAAVLYIAALVVISTFVEPIFYM